MGDEPVPLGELVNIQLVFNDTEELKKIEQVEYHFDCYTFDVKTGERVQKNALQWENKLFFGAGLTSQKVYIECCIAALKKTETKENNKTVQHYTLELYKISREIQLGNPTPVLSVTGNCAAITEGESCIVTATLSQPATRHTVVNFSRSGEGKADVEATDAISIPVGASSGTMTVKALQDNVKEGSKQVCFTVFASPDYQSSDNQCCFVILDGTPPEPPRPPDFNNGKFKLEKFAYETALSQVNASKLKSSINNVINTYRGIVASVAAGVHKNPESAVAALRETMSSIEPDAWKNFHRMIGDYTYNLHKNGTFSGNMSDFTTAWEEIANGLEKLQQRL